MKGPEIDRLFDKRTVRRSIAMGRVQKDDYERFVKSLPDLAEQVRAKDDGGDEDGFEHRFGGVPREQRAIESAPQPPAEPMRSEAPHAAPTQPSMPGAPPSMPSAQPSAPAPQPGVAPTSTSMSPGTMPSPAPSPAPAPAPTPAPSPTTAAPQPEPTAPPASSTETASPPAPDAGPGPAREPGSDDPQGGA